MLRPTLRGVATTSLRQPMPMSALNSFGRRLLSSQMVAGKPGQMLWRWRSSPFQNIRARSRYGTSHVGFAMPIQETLGGASKRGFQFSAWQRSSQGQATQKPLTLGARLRRLTKEYGWATVGVYFALSVLDFPFCFLLVQTVGAETIGKVEHYVVSTATAVIPESVRHQWSESVGKIWSAIRGEEKKELGSHEATEKVEMATWGVEEAQKRNREDASLATILALAYAIHKSLIFFRVPLTAAVTPKVVKTLRSWGWKIGKRTPPTAS